MSVFKRLNPFFKRCWPDYLVGIIMLIIVDAGGLIYPQVLKRVSDSAAAGMLGKDLILTSALQVIGLGLVVAVARFIWRNQIFGTSRKLDYWLRDKLFRHYLELDDRYYSSRRVGDLMAHATNDVKAVREAFGGGIMLVVDSVFMTLFTVIMMLYTVGFITTLVALSALPFLTFGIARIMKPLHRRSTVVQASFSDLTTVVQEDFSGIKVIKAFAIESDRGERFSEANERYRRHSLKLARLDTLLDPLIELIMGVNFVVFFIYAIGQLRGGALTVGDFIAMISYLYIIIWPVIAMGLIANQFQRGIASMGRLNEILSAQSAIREAKCPVRLDHPKGLIEFRDVSFRYNSDSPWILRHVSFTLEPGRTLAVLGRTGEGKSTLIALMLRRFDVTEGQILIDGIDIRDLSLNALHELMGLVPQESFLFSTTIAENIAFGGDTIDRVRIEAAAKFAQVHGDIAGMPEGYDTAVGERGVTLSGGQQQRVAIARAYYRDADVLILDDALSAVDTDTEHRILQALRAHEKGMLIISQRISTIQDADEIIVLSGGGITERGDHEQLMAQDGFYAQTYRRQLLERAVDEADVSEAEMTEGEAHD